MTTVTVNISWLNSYSASLVSLDDAMNLLMEIMITYRVAIVTADIVAALCCSV